MQEKRHIRFENPELQAEFVCELKRRGLPHFLNKEGAAVFGSSDGDAVTDVAHWIRDRHFRWYFLKWDSATQSECFQRVLEKEHLRFLVEHHESGTWFVVPREDEMYHQRLFSQVSD